MASPCTAFTPSDSLATANNSWILILTFAITSLPKEKTDTYMMPVSSGISIPFSL